MPDPKLTAVFEVTTESGTLSSVIVFRPGTPDFAISTC
jgi:hypothetical protein